MQQQPFFHPFLEAVLRRSGADGAYVYRFNEEGHTAHLSVWSGLAPNLDSSVIQGQLAHNHLERESPLVLHKDAWVDSRFATLPEFDSNPFEGVISIPILHAGQRLGILNLCRLTPTSIPPGELAFLLGLGLPLGALLAADSEVSKLERQLADRKLLDRAKGILQSSFSWNEEQAYLHLRRTSRQRRTPMRDIALEVIERGKLRLVGARHAS